MKYICLGYLEPGKFEGMTEAERNAVLDECFEHNDHLRANGQLVAAVPLQPPETALTMPFGLSHSFQDLILDLDRLRYGRLRI
jgi:hypothetical protein